MCQFCVEHGEGKRWYLQAQNYAFDLKHDVDRAQFMTDFVQNFSTMRTRSIAGMEVLTRMPDFVKRPIKQRVVDHQRINHYGQPLSLEDCINIFDMVSSITLVPCVCRSAANTSEGEAVCMLVTTTPVLELAKEAFSDYSNGPDLGDFQVIDKDQAIALLRRCEEKGLMHSVWTFKTPYTAAICNCNVESGCLAMKMTTQYDLRVMWKGEDCIEVDSQRCIHCRKCVSICPFKAISVANRRVIFDESACYGCGICRNECTHGALKLVARKPYVTASELW